MGKRKITEVEGTKTLIIIALIAVIVIIALFIVFYRIWIGSDRNPLTNSDKVDTLVGLLVLIIGSAATIGGAYATVKVATAALNISKQQVKYENIEFIEKVQSIFSEIAISLGDIFASGVSVHVKSQSESPLDKENITILMPIQELNNLSSNIEHLCCCLKKMLMNDLAYKCFLFSIQKNDDLKCKMLNSELKMRDTDKTHHSIYTLDLNDLSSVINVLDLSRERIMNRGEKGIDNANKLTLLAKFFNLSYNNANVRSFFFLGNLILGDLISCNLYANYGAALLHDLFFVLPDDGVINEVLKNDYPDIYTMMDIKKFSPKDKTSIYFKQALKDAEQIGNKQNNLYLSEKK